MDSTKRKDPLSLPCIASVVQEICPAIAPRSTNIYVVYPVAQRFKQGKTAPPCASLIPWICRMRSWPTSMSTATHRHIWGLHLKSKCEVMDQTGVLPVRRWFCHWGTDSNATLTLMKDGAGWSRDLLNSKSHKFQCRSSSKQLVKVVLQLISKRLCSLCRTQGRAQPAVSWWTWRRQAQTLQGQSVFIHHGY